MSDTPETIAAVEASDGQWSFVLKQTCAKLEGERDQWKADCLELLATSADREEKLRTDLMLAHKLADAAIWEADRLRAQLRKEQT